MNKSWLANDHHEIAELFMIENAFDLFLLTADTNDIAKTGDQHMKEQDYKNAQTAYESIFSPVDLVKKNLEIAPHILFWGVLLKYQAANNLAAIAIENKKMLQGISQLSYAIFYEIFFCLQNISCTENWTSFEKQHTPNLTSWKIANDVIPATKELNPYQILPYETYFAILSNYLYTFAVKLPESAFAPLFLMAINIITHSNLSIQEKDTGSIKKLTDLNDLLHKIKPRYFKKPENRALAAAITKNTCKIFDSPKDYVTAVAKIHQILNEI